MTRTRYTVTLGPRRFATTSPHVAESMSRIGATVTATTGDE